MHVQGISPTIRNASSFKVIESLTEKIECYVEIFIPSDISSLRASRKYILCQVSSSLAVSVLNIQDISSDLEISAMSCHVQKIQVFLSLSLSLLSSALQYPRKHGACEDEQDASLSPSLSLPDVLEDVNQMKGSVGRYLNLLPLLRPSPLSSSFSLL